MYVYHRLYKYIDIYHIFFMHSSADRRLGGFHILAITSNAAMNVRMPYT